MSGPWNYPSVQNHELIEGAEPQGMPSAVSVPTLVVHGTADPLFRVEHGEALARAIPDARLLLLDGAGHGVEPADWEPLAAAIAEHTGRG